MENKKITLSREELLLQARLENWSQPIVGTLRSHGKLWGMDVFSWYKANVGELQSTLSSFPGPVCWYANQAEVQALIDCDGCLPESVNMICTYDKAGFSFPNEVIDQTNILLGAAEIEDALELIKALKQQHRILIFTSSADNWQEHHQSFEYFLKLQQ